jgi:hypothetical protein
MPEDLIIELDPSIWKKRSVRDSLTLLLGDLAEELENGKYVRIYYHGNTLVLGPRFKPAQLVPMYSDGWVEMSRS